MNDAKCVGIVEEIEAVSTRKKKQVKITRKKTINEGKAQCS